MWWSCWSEMIKKHFSVLHAKKNILCFDEDSRKFVFVCNEMGILNIALNNINLVNNFNDDDPESITPIWLLAWHIKNAKTHLKNI